MHQRFKAVSCLAACVVLGIGSTMVASADPAQITFESAEVYQVSNNVAAGVIEQKVSFSQELTKEFETQAEMSELIKETLGTDIANIAVAQVNDYVNVRVSASEDSEVVGKLFDNSVAAVEATEDGWTKIKSGSVEGYVRSDFVVIGDEELIRSAATTVATVKAQTLNVRSEATTDASIVTMAAQEASLDVVTAEEDGWIQVSTDAGEGYVSSEYVEVSTKFKTAMTKAEEEAELLKTSAGKGQAVANYACQFVGNPYVYGGTSLTNGTDCSGFVMSVYAHYGVGMSHSSYAMRSVGREVEYSEMQAGDIVCYEGHVGIYVGNNTIVHASNEKDGIKYTSPANYRKIVAIRRVF